MISKVELNKDLIKEVKLKVQKEINNFENEFVKQKYHISVWLIREILSTYYKCRWEYLLNGKDKE